MYLHATVQLLMFAAEIKMIILTLLSMSEPSLVGGRYTWWTR